MTILCMRIPRWIPKATHKHSEYVIIIVFQWHQWLHKRFPVLRYTQIACLVEISGVECSFMSICIKSHFFLISLVLLIMT